jgi:hypothetical protein
MTGQRLTSFFHRSSSSGTPSLAVHFLSTCLIRLLAISITSSIRPPSSGSQGKTIPANDLDLPDREGRPSHSSIAEWTFGKIS